MSDPLTEVVDSFGPRDKVHRIAREEGLSPDIADDFLKVTNFESGGGHYDRSGKVKLSPVNRNGQRAVGFSQILPSTAKGVDAQLDPFKEDDNIRLGLRYFNQGGADPTARRIHYFGGPGPAARYKQTGRIPQGSDALGTTFQQYVQQTGARAKDPLTETTREQDPLSQLTQQQQAASTAQAPQQPDVQTALAQLGNRVTRATQRLVRQSQQPQSLLLPRGQRNAGPNEPATFGLGQPYKETQRRAQEQQYGTYAPLFTGNTARGAPTMSSVLQDVQAEQQTPRGRLREQLRQQVAGERNAAGDRWIPRVYTQNPITAVAESLGAKSIGQFTSKLLDNPIGAISDIGSTTEEQSISNEVDRRERQIAEDTREAHRLLLDDRGKFRQDVLDDYQNLQQYIEKDPRGWWRGIDVGKIEAGARVFRTIAGLAELANTGGAYLGGKPIQGLADDLRRKAITAERAMQDIREGALPTEEQMQRRAELGAQTVVANPTLARGSEFTTKEEAAAFVTNTLADLAQLHLFTAAAGPTGGFAAFEGLQSLGRNERASQVIGSTVKGAALGKTFALAPAARSLSAGPLANFAREAAAVGTGTAGVELASGATPEQAAKSAGFNVLFHGAGQVAKIPGALRGREQAAEPQPTVPTELQNRLAARDYGATTIPTDRPASFATDLVTETPEAPASDPLAEITADVQRRAAHYSNRQPRRQRNVKTGKKGQFKKGAPEPEPTTVEVRGKEYTQDELGDWYDSSGRKVKQASVLRAIEVEQALPVQKQPTVTETPEGFTVEQTTPSGKVTVQSTGDAGEVVNVLTGKKLRKKPTGFINVTEIHDAIKEVQDRFDMNETEAREFLEEQRPFLFRPGVSRAEEVERTQQVQAAQEGLNKLTKLLDPQRRFDQMVRGWMADFPDLTVEQARRNVEIQNPELARQLKGDLGVQDIEQLRTNRGPAGYVDPNSPAAAANKFAKERLADFADYYGDEGDLTGRQPKTPEERRAEAFTMPKDAEFQIRKERDGTFMAQWFHPTKPLTGEHSGFKTEAEAQRYIDENWKPETAIDLTSRDVDAGPRMSIPALSKALKRALMNEPTERVYADRGWMPRDKEGKPLLDRPLDDRAAAFQVLEERLGKYSGGSVSSWPLPEPTEAFKRALETEPKDIGKPLAERSLGNLKQYRQWLADRNASKAELDQVDQLIAEKTGKKSGEEGYVHVSEIAKAIRKVKDEVFGKERNLGYVLTLPTGRELAVDFTIDRRGLARPMMGPINRGDTTPDVTGSKPLNLGVDTVLALKRFLMQTHPEIKRVQFERAGSTGGKLGRRVNLPAVPRTTPELPPAAAPPRAVDLDAVREQLGRQGYLVRGVEDAPIPTFSVVNARGREIAKFASSTRERALQSLADFAERGVSTGEEGHINVGDIAKAVRELKQQFPEKNEAELRAMAIQRQEKLQPSEVESQRIGRRVMTAMNRYATTKTVADIAALPDTTETAKPEIRQVAQNLKALYSALERSPVRTQGFEAVNDAAARKYLKTLAEFTRVHQPERTDLVQRAEDAYAKGDYAEAQRLTENALSGTHEFVSKLGGALMSRKETPQWHEILTEVRRRAKEMGIENPVERFLKSEEGSLNIPGKKRKVYDVTKSPKGGKPDTDAIAAIIDPAVEKIWVHANQLVQQGKARGKSPEQITRDMFARMVDDGLSDWHILNRNAAKAVAARRLSQIARVPEKSVSMKAEKVPTEPTPAEQAQILSGGKPPTKPKSVPKNLAKNSLWMTLMKSGRQGGSKTYHTPEQMAEWTRQANKLLSDLGLEAAERFYEVAKPSGVRTEVGRVLGDYYQIEAARTNDPELLQRSIDLANERVTGAVELGRAVKAFDVNNRFTLSGALDEATRLYRQGVKDPAAKLPTDLAKRVNDLAVKRDNAKKKVDDLTVKVESEPHLSDKALAAFRKKLRMKQEGGYFQFGKNPEVVAARKRKTAAAKQLRTMEKQVGKYWTKESQPALEEARIELRDATYDLSMLYHALQQRGSNSPTGYAQRMLNLQRSLMVSAFSTAIRNTQTQVERSVVERLTDAVEATLRKAVGLNAEFSYADIARNTKRLADTSSWDFAEQILKEHPDEFFRMFSTYAGGVEIPFPNPVARGFDKAFGGVERAAYWFNTFNRIQEFHIRSAEFLAELELHTKKQTGISLEQFIAQRGAEKLPPKLISAAIDKALEVTFAADSPTDTDFGRVMHTLIRFGNKLPPTMSPAAFPRFMYNNLKFLYQYSPLGALDIPRVAYRGGNVPRAIARTMLGTSMLLLGYQIRKDDKLAGGKWYELKTPAGTFDMRPFGPFSTYLFFGEAAKRWSKGERPLSFREWAEALGSSTAPGGLSISTIERLYGYYEKGDWDKIGRVLKSEGGDMARAILTPVRQFKDIIAQFDAQERITRDTSEQPFLGPIRESIPFASRSLPPAYRATSGRPVQQEAPLAKVLTGFRKVSPKSYIEDELDRLHFRSSEIRSYTGIPALDNRISQRMGEHLDQQAEALRSDPRYQKASDKLKFVLLKAELQRARKQALGDAARELPEEYRQYKTRGIPAYKRELIKERTQPAP